jgi:hypothetical protein
MPTVSHQPVSHAETAASRKILNTERPLQRSRIWFSARTGHDCRGRGAVTAARRPRRALPSARIIPNPTLWPHAQPFYSSILSHLACCRQHRRPRAWRGCQVCVSPQGCRPRSCAKGRPHRQRPRPAGPRSRARLSSPLVLAAAHAVLCEKILPAPGKNISQYS